MKTNAEGGNRDEAWFEALFRSHHVKIRAYALRRSPNEADDIVSQVFETAWKNRDRVPEDALPWLYRTASNHLLHEYRSSMRRTNREERAESQTVTQLQIDPTDTLANNLDQVREVQRALSQLSETDAEVLRLWAWEQLEIAEIAIVTNCSPATARVRLHRARKRCAALLPDARPHSSNVHHLAEELS